MTAKRLYKSDDDKIISGVCGGIAEYLNVDPSIVRLIAALLIFASGVAVGIAIYIIAAIILPKKSSVV
ncbi:PspC domain-containing protein [Papillibacter cinnamivorans]|uniref:Phage shock protein C (PspC) family protein n=1 Tax=Papillibacter cinnamivorans DSM 12816 TaxID=1122930 RepID=A0A1W2A596_9FIRM|nr:PspC domain-containing protein [Papillibacter cinnamivorans]SMC55753.1 phage shock protein C (PspC) family protein [Papillibacter cinnamivorans DSM 12816]